MSKAIDPDDIYDKKDTIIACIPGAELYPDVTIDNLRFAYMIKTLLFDAMVKASSGIHIDERLRDALEIVISKYDRLSADMLDEIIAKLKLDRDLPNPKQRHTTRCKPVKKRYTA